MWQYVVAKTQRRNHTKVKKFKFLCVIESEDWEWEFELLQEVCMTILADFFYIHGYHMQLQEYGLYFITSLALC